MYSLLNNIYYIYLPIYFNSKIISNNLLQLLVNIFFISTDLRLDMGIDLDVF